MYHAYLVCLYNIVHRRWAVVFPTDQCSLSGREGVGVGRLGFHFQHFFSVGNRLLYCYNILFDCAQDFHRRVAARQCANHESYTLCTRVKMMTGVCGKKKFKQMIFHKSIERQKYNENTVVLYIVCSLERIQTIGGTKNMICISVGCIMFTPYIIQIKL